MDIHTFDEHPDKFHPHIHAIVTGTFYRYQFVSCDETGGSEPLGRAVQG